MTSMASLLYPLADMLGISLTYEGTKVTGSGKIIIPMMGTSIVMHPEVQARMVNQNTGQALVVVKVHGSLYFVLTNNHYKGTVALWCLDGDSLGAYPHAILKKVAIKRSIRGVHDLLESGIRAMWFRKTLRGAWQKLAVVPPK